MENREALEEEISAVFRKIPSEEVLKRLDSAGIANARMRSVEDFLEHPQLAARDRWREVGSPVGPLRALLPPGIPADIEPVMTPIPAVGEHTDAILGELGYAEQTIADLRGQSAV